MTEHRRSVGSYVERVLAIVGAVALILVISSAVIGRLTDGHVKGIVLTSEDDRPIPNVPVFLDDETGTVRRTVTAADGTFRFAIEPARLRRARVLICPPERLAIISDEQPTHLVGTNSLHSPRRPPGSRKLRGWEFGWRAAVPAECDAVLASPTGS
ncbi:MAG: hypothetical protein V4550_04515 [Gemmatimonadota bacterium]